MSRICPLENFGFLKISGPDAIKFLQGYTTCDLPSLSEEFARMGAICNLQGRMLSSFLVIRQGNDLLLRMDRSLVPATIGFLQKYIVFSKAEMADMSETVRCFGLLEAGEADPMAVTSENGGTRINLGNRQELWMPTEADIIADASPAEWQSLEIAAGTAWVTAGTSEAFIPQMLNYHQQDAIDFTKGCYLGQEIVARMQYRGELKRRLHRIRSNKARNRDDRLVDGDIVAVQDHELLAVLKNTTSEPVTAAFQDGEQVEAIPLI